MPLCICVFPDNYKEMVDKKKLFEKQQDIWISWKRSDMMKKKKETASQPQAAPNKALDFSVSQVALVPPSFSFGCVTRN